MESCVLTAARELFLARAFPGVVVVCTEALVEEPRDLSLRLLRARALVALRRDAAAQGEVSEILRIDPRCGGAYRLLGELAVRRDEPGAAREFLLEALRCSPGDDEAKVWLAIVDRMLRGAATGAAHVRLRPREAVRPPSPSPQVEAPVVAAAPPPPPPPPPARVVAAAPPPPPAPARVAARPPPLPAAARAPRPSIPPPLPPGAMRRRAAARGTQPPSARPLTPLPTTGFAAYLVDIGVLGELQLRAALAYKRSTGVRLGAAAVALGFATEARIESASLVYHGRHRRPSTIDVVATARAARHSDVYA